MTTVAAEQTPPFAMVHGQPLHELPMDLYIPPDALEIILETFEGPLDLLLYLIRRQHLDILAIPLTEITRQYLVYIELMQALKLELAAEYLVMAALLCEIKSRLLLPNDNPVDSDEPDLQATLIQRLLEYEQIKQAAVALDQLPQLGRDVFAVCIAPPMYLPRRPPPPVALTDVLNALQQVLKRAQQFTAHQVIQEPLSQRDRMTVIMAHLQTINSVSFYDLLTLHEGRAGVVITLLAVLELMRAALLDCIQAEPFAPLQIRLCQPSANHLIM
ncbi:segregation and condensation protein A [Thiospirillum jenense]|uniref:Segregation and condensation protein A n=1 Tax=Thiospirillum jenense TaxID=1653858 RepID=A0A839HAF9_9GAMM|nr:segregation/condensation protein A [Thiospirillum jenense]MBB1125674.1 segregation/condensation protein A [Thiospirillum jenense]